jgi:riboflavin kinase
LSHIFSKKLLPGYFRPGVTAGKAAEMEVVVVPSLPKQSHLYTAADEVINSLLDLQLEKWGLPPFADCKSRIP